MKPLRFPQITILIAACLLLLISYPAQAYDYGYARVVRLSLVQGDVQMARSGDSAWEKAVINMPIEQGFTVGTNDGRAEIEFESGATARLAEKSVLRFDELALSNGGRITRLTLTQGTATFYANLKSDDTFVVAAPEFQVTVPKRSEFRIDVMDGGASVSVLQGSASVNSPAGTREIAKGQTLAFSASQPDQARVERNPATDDWDRWVNHRESTIDTQTANTLRYTSAPFSYGLSDLAAYGGWNYVPGYGYAWQPWGISPGWAPFWDGYWGFSPALGWTWISYEPWGWVPYHFGSWEYSPAFGWFWVPGYYNYWCPAPVQWVAVGKQVGWRPVSPQRPRTSPSSPAPTSSGGPVVFSKGKLGQGGPNRVIPDNHLDSRIRVLSAPPSPNGKMAKTPSPSVAADTALRGQTLAVVPTAPAAAGRGSEIVFSATENRFVNAPANSSSETQSSGTVILKKEPPVRGAVLVVPLSPTNAPNAANPPASPASRPAAPPMQIHVSPPPVRVQPPQPPRPMVSQPQPRIFSPPPPPPRVSVAPPHR
jgi:hypothetical protein